MYTKFAHLIRLHDGSELMNLDCSKLWDVAMWQQIMKDSGLNSWFANFKYTTFKYLLPHPIDVLNDPAEKEEMEGAV